MAEKIGFPGDTNALRRGNRAQVLRLLDRWGPATRGALSAASGLTPAAISRITREMLDAGILIDGDPIAAQGRLGRRETLLSINPAGAYVLAIALTANRRGIALTDALGAVIAARDCDDLAMDDPERMLAALADRAAAMVRETDFDAARLLGVGVAAALSEESGADLITSRPLGWEGVPARAILSERLGLPVRIEHRASAIARAELSRNGGRGSLYLVNVALGIGVAAHLGGRMLVPGSPGFGSLSHFAVPGGEAPCACGRRGCLEASASGGAILAELGLAGCPLPERALRLIEAVAAADAGDARVRAAFGRAGRILAVGIDAALSLMAPRAVLLAGEVGRQAAYLDGVRAGLRGLGRADADTVVARSAVTSTEAAASVALQEYVLTGTLDLARLRAA